MISLNMCFLSSLKNTKEVMHDYPAISVFNLMKKQFQLGEGRDFRG